MLKNSPNTGHDEESAIIVALNPHGKAIMTRNMELIRKIVLEVQARKDLKRRAIKIDGVDEPILARHVEMLFGAGLLEGTISDDIGRGYPTILVYDLSMDGHDFAAVIANESVWAKVKQSLSPSDLVTVPLRIIKDVGVGLLGEYVKQKVGLSD
jgi:hypothetical protein